MVECQIEEQRNKQGGLISVPAAQTVEPVPCNAENEHSGTPFEIYFHAILLSNRLVSIYPMYTFNSPREMGQLLSQIHRYIWSNFTPEEQEEINNSVLHMQDTMAIRLREMFGNNQREDKLVDPQADFALNDLVDIAQRYFSRDLDDLLDERVRMILSRTNPSASPIDVRLLIIDQVRYFLDAKADENDISTGLWAIDIDEILKTKLLMSIIKVFDERKIASTKEVETKKRIEALKDYFIQLLGKDGLKFGAKSAIDAINVICKYLADSRKGFHLSSAFPSIFLILIFTNLFAGCVPFAPDYEQSSPDDQSMTFYHNGEQYSVAETCALIERIMDTLGVDLDQNTMGRCLAMQRMDPTIHAAGYLDIQVEDSLVRQNVVVGDGGSIKAPEHELIHPELYQVQKWCRQESPYFCPNTVDKQFNVYADYIHDLQGNEELANYSTVLYKTSLEIHDLGTVDAETFSLSTPFGNREFYILYLPNPNPDDTRMYAQVVDITQLSEALLGIVWITPDIVSGTSIIEISDEKLKEELSKYPYFGSYPVYNPETGETYLVNSDLDSIVSIVKFVIADIHAHSDSGTLKDSYFARIMNAKNYPDQVSVFMEMILQIAPDPYSMEYMNLIKALLQPAQGIYGPNGFDPSYVASHASTYQGERSDNIPQKEIIQLIFNWYKVMKKE